MSYDIFGFFKTQDKDCFMQSIKTNVSNIILKKLELVINDLNRED